MNKIIIPILLLFSLFIPCLRAQDTPQPINENSKHELIDSIAASYYDWSEISMSGKLSSPMLPLSPSVKVFMIKDQLTVISVSAPLMGEVARIEVDPEQAIVVNKMSNTYASLSIEEIEPVCPGGLTALQNMLLGRITILGEGQLNRGMGESLEIYATNPSTWLLLPNQDLENAEFVYFYTLNSRDLLLDRFVVLTQDETGQLESDYTWSKKEMKIEMTAAMGGNSMSATLKLNNPDQKTKPLDRIELGSKYRKVSPAKILKM